ncbi:trans-resveratrol di-O-methyltransferase-like [Vigna radiata var. radiata]|uniref:isoflavone 7-O-methyltransferase n=1 Tax=Vigna radiata var. radiata TaxID=3916 RepID=A0A1S3TIP6_VIGRR|nr:trans-resveratrol di-O-methyltransferase-like [Vigna radiata var. radiata]
METEGEEHASKLLRAQNHVWNHILKFINSVSLKCAIELSIPDIIHNYGQPMSLSQLIASLPLHPSKISFITRLMKILTHSGFFSEHHATPNQPEVMYLLTDASMLLLKDHPFSMKPVTQLIFNPVMMNPWFQFSTWFTNETPSPFHSENGMGFWDFAGREPNINNHFNEVMAMDSRLVSNVVIEKYKRLFEGIESLVDVGGGTGTMAKVIVESFPHVKCIVFDLPHVVAGLEETQNIKYVGGDMLEAIPHAGSIMLKWVLHDWKDKECVKILKNCKEAIASDGRVLIIDIVMENKKEDHELTEAQFFFDMYMMMLFAGKERYEKEWANLILSAGFSNYKITPTVGLVSIIEVYP